MRKPKNVTVHKTVSTTDIYNSNTVSNPPAESNGIGWVSAKGHSQTSPSISDEKSSNAGFAEQINALSDVYLNAGLQTLSCGICADKSSICAYCSGEGQDYDTWSDNTGGHGFTTDMNKSGEKIQFLIWLYETSHITVAERLEQRKWCGPGQKL